MISVMVWVARQRQVEQVREPLRLKGDDRVEVVVQQQLRRGLLLHVAAEEREERPVSAPDDLGVQRRHQLRPVEVVGIGQRHADRVGTPPAQIGSGPVQPESRRRRFLPHPFRQLRPHPPLVAVVQHQRNRRLGKIQPPRQLRHRNRHDFHISRDSMPLIKSYV